jgi:hypothetical protein
MHKTIETWRKTSLLIPKCFLFKYTIQGKTKFLKFFKKILFFIDSFRVMPISKYLLKKQQMFFF